MFSKVNHDLLRPLGKYIGVNPISDDARSEEENFTPLIIRLKEDSYSDAQAAEDSSSLQESQSDANPDTDENDKGIPHNLLGMHIDDFLPDSAEEIEQNAEPEIFSKFLIVDGKEFLKASIVAGLSSNRSKKVPMRTLQSGGMALEDLCNSRSKLNELDPEDLEDGNLMQRKDLVGVLVRSGQKFCLAVLEVTAFHFGTSKITKATALMDDLEDKDKQITVIGQIINLHMSSHRMQFWEWTKDYIMLDTNSENEMLTHRQYVMEIPSILVHPLAPTILIKSASLDTTDTTWKLASHDLWAVIDSLWESLEPNTEKIFGHVESLPSINNSSSLPYRDFWH